MYQFTIQDSHGMTDLSVGVHEKGFLCLVTSLITGRYQFQIGFHDRLWVRYGDTAYVPWTGGFRRDLWAKSGLQFLSDVCDYADGYAACDLLWLYVISALTLRGTVQFPDDARHFVHHGDGQDELTALEDQLFLRDDGRPMEEYIEIVDEFKSTRTRKG